MCADRPQYFQALGIYAPLCSRLSTSYQLDTVSIYQNVLLLIPVRQASYWSAQRAVDGPLTGTVLVGVNQSRDGCVAH